MNKTELSLMPLEDILEELDKRFDYCVFGGIKKRQENVDDEQSHWNGGSIQCAGIADFLNKRIMKQILKAVEEQEGDNSE